MAPFNLTLKVPKSLKNLPGRLSRSNSPASDHSASDQSVSPTTSPRPTIKSIDWAESGPGEAGAWISPAPDGNRRPDIIESLGSFLQSDALCTVWPLTDYKMTKHYSVEAAQTAAATRGTSAWYVEGLAYVPSSKEPAEASDMTAEEIALTKRPWGDADEQSEGAHPAEISFPIEAKPSIKRNGSDDVNESDGGSSYVNECCPDQFSPIETSPWEESFASSTEDGHGSRAPALGDLSLEDSSEAWK